MDNISRRLSNEDTANSMYLSFDAESTMSTACYKTLEAMSDMSALSAIDMDETDNINGTGDNNANSTLEAGDGSQIKSPLKTVKKNEISGLKSHTPLIALPKNILKEYKALCSTPSKEQLMKTVDVTRGSDATRCIDLGLAFVGVDDGKPAYFPPPLTILSEENKENILTDIEEVSTLSGCSSVEITTSIIEKKILNSVSTVMEGELEDNIKVTQNVEKNLIVTEIPDKAPKDEKTVTNDVPIENKQFSEEVMDNYDSVPNSIVKNNEYMSTISESLEGSDDNIPTVRDECINVDENTKTKSCVTKIAVFSKNYRRSICEPNLKTNKPSRISASTSKEKKLLPSSKRSTVCTDAEIEIPILMDKILKISKPTFDENSTNGKVVEQIIKDQKTISAEKRRSTKPSMQTRTSLIPSTAGDKRPFSFTQRMSVVVKTTLNSPARKISRKSLMGGASSLQRRSVISQKTTTTISSEIKKPEITSRRSMLPKACGVTANTNSIVKNVPSLQESSSKMTNTTKRNSLYPPTTISEKNTGYILHKKLDVAYTCNVCKEKFRIKSLLDAHKRSHEIDNTNPFIKKTSTVPHTSSMESSNQCKYCDKKFALIKALHIHLLQNCPKIPPSEKKKLQYTDLNHVEKAQLPNVFTSHHYQPSNTSSTVSSANATPRNTLRQTSITLPKSSGDLLNDKKDNCNNMAPPQGSVQKVKKTTAHAGVYRTPSKTVPCHLCKLTFKSILDYTNHNLTIHGKNKTKISTDLDNKM